MSIVISLIILKLIVSYVVVQLAHRYKWNMAYVLPVMATLWVPIIYVLVLRSH